MTNGRQGQSRQGKQGTEEESQAHVEGEEEIETGKEEEPVTTGSLQTEAAFLCGCYNGPMSTLSRDTHPKMEQLQIELIREMPSWKKFAILDGLNKTVKSLAIAGIRERLPDATPEQIHRALASLMLGEELARKVYDHAG